MPDILQTSELSEDSSDPAERDWEQDKDDEVERFRRRQVHFSYVELTSRLNPELLSAMSDQSILPGRSCTRTPLPRGKGILPPFERSLLTVRLTESR